MSLTPGLGRELGAQSLQESWAYGLGLGHREAPCTIFVMYGAAGYETTSGIMVPVECIDAIEYAHTLLSKWLYTKQP